MAEVSPARIFSPGPEKAARVNRESERNPRRLRRGLRVNLKKTAFLTVEDSLQLAAGIFNPGIVDARGFCYDRRPPDRRERTPSCFRPQTRGLGALGDYSGGHVLAKVLSSAVLGIDAYRVEVEVDISSGLPSFATVGLPEAAVKESRERVKSAITNSGYRFPDDRITVNLAPADIKKEGTGFDLPIALGILAATGVVPQEMVFRYLVLGELSLDGRVKPVRGSLPMALSAREAGHLAIIVPHENGREASVISDIDVLPVRTLSQVVGFLRGQTAIAPEKTDIHAMFNRENAFDVDYAEVCGQEHAKRALEIAAAGGHNLIMVGPPGSGKTMLAKRLPTILIIQ